MNTLSAPTGFRVSVENLQATFTWNTSGGVAYYRIYTSANLQGPYSLLDGVAYPTATFTQGGLTKGQVYYFRLSAVDPQAQESCLGDTVIVMTNDTFRYEVDSAGYRVQYLVNGKWVRYYLNRQTVHTTDNQYYEQFIPLITYNGLALTTTPYLGGLSGLLLLRIGMTPLSLPVFGSVVETVSSNAITIRYINLESTTGLPIGAVNVRMIFDAAKPYVQIASRATVTQAMSGFLFGWNFFPAFNGVYNPASRVVVPYNQTSYYVINGQALGIHYFPREEPWSLRMGAAGTAYANYTMGFFGLPAEMEPLTTGWAMGHDYCPNQDTVPFNLDTIFDQLYVNYQEDEGGFCTPSGLGYGWQNPETAPQTLSAGDTYEASLYFWAGEDSWTGAYGLNNDATYQFNIDRLYNQVQTLTKSAPRQLGIPAARR